MCEEDFRVIGLSQVSQPYIPKNVGRRLFDAQEKVYTTYVLVLVDFSRKATLPIETFSCGL